MSNNPQVPLANDATFAASFARFETKLDMVLSNGVDHEARLRVQESRKTVSPRDLWMGLSGAIAVAASLSVFISNVFPGGA